MLTEGAPHMCRAVVCPACGKPTWKGCGLHVEQVLADVPRNRRCTCSEEQKAAAAPSLWARLRGR